MKKIERTLLEEMEQKARELRSESEQEAIIAGALILLVLGVSPWSAPSSSPAP
ncbi:hypothetical protein SGLAM104S_03408 [Streptomyces glaucescens]